ncbi:MAG TPA: rhamnan synthesis F family protein, partial [Puia sp.]|nr:rhamnan synthesis F family protein [Puia sp.]
MKVAVHAHMHYTDLMEHVAGYLRRIPFPFDCIVTLTDGTGGREVSRTLRSIVPQARVAIVTVINKGRDVKPFYTDLAGMLPDYDIIAHIHGKKSVFNKGATAGWLDYLLDCLLGSETTIKKILRRFEEEEQTGLIYPAIFPGLPYWANSWLCNRNWAARLAGRLQLDELPQGFFSFPAGNMFWARTAAIQPLLQLGLRETDYPEENGQTDGEIMHALERLVSVVSRAHGFTNYVIRPTTDGIELKDDRDGIDFSVYHHRSLEYLRQRIDKTDIRVVSFDIFDTLIVRALPDPADIFDLMQPAVEKMTSQPVDFRRIRTEADSWLRERLEPGKDVTLKEIYHRVGDVLRLSEADREELLQQELALEIKFTRSRPDVVAVMNYAYDRGKQVVLASDMYLDRTFVAKMLRRLGIVRYHRMYLSSELGKRKDTRTLFPHILETEGVRVDEMIHIGDNEHTDLQIPGDLGIHWFHVMRPLELYHQTPLGKTGFPHRDIRLSAFARISFGLMLAKIFNDPFPKNPSPVNGNLHDFGYWYFGPVLLAYVKWVLDRAAEDGVETLYFVSRDGDILVRICRLLAEQLPGPTPKAVYLEVSRRSIGVPFIESRDQLDKLLTAEYLSGPLSELIRVRLGIDLADCPGVNVQSYGFAGIDVPVSIPEDLFRI